MDDEMTPTSLQYAICTCVTCVYRQFPEPNPKKNKGKRKDSKGEKEICDEWLQRRHNICTKQKTQLTHPRDSHRRAV